MMMPHPVNTTLFKLNDSEGTQDNIPPLPDARQAVVGAPADTGPILPVPKGIRPTLAKYR